MVTAANRLNATYERDLSVRMTLLNRLDLAYTDPATDPYTGTNVYLLLAENMANMGAVLGVAEFDVGHVLTSSPDGDVGGWRYDRVTGAVNYTLGQLAAQAPGTYHETFHFVLNNHVAKDNRIPPYGMSYEEARKRNALPVPASQFGNPGPNGTYNYWDEVPLNPPAGAAYGAIGLLYQPTSWEYIQFLDHANNRKNAFLANEGANLLDAWLNTGMAAPHAMDVTAWGADADADGLADAWEGQFGLDPQLADASADPDGDGRTNAQEYLDGTQRRSGSGGRRAGRRQGCVDVHSRRQHGRHGRHGEGTAAVREWRERRATRRFDVDIGAQFPVAAARRFGAVVESLGPASVPIVVERSMYWSAEGVVWAAGTNAVATRLP